MNAASDDVTRLADVRVLVVGDLMLDEYVWGEVTRISPEAPVPVVQVRRRTHVPGGAANAAAGIVALGGEASLIGIVGADEGGRTLRTELEGRRIGVAGLTEVAGRATTTKTRVIAHSQQVVRTDVEELDGVPEHASELVLQAIDAGSAGVQAVVLSDYGKGLVSPAVAARAIERAAELGVPIVVDPKGGEYSKYRGATVITPNVHETELATRLQIVDSSTLESAAFDLRDRLDGTAVLITRGPDGMSLFTASGRTDIPTAARSVYDVTGAGDTVVAVLALALGAKLDLVAAARLANAAAGVAVGKVGTAAVEAEELRAALA
jgi:D-beta-D-heptose 7-phosphate kinase/D-beta-D-heptose 1-phosphate adenosyltransferase